MELGEQKETILLKTGSGIGVLWWVGGGGWGVLCCQGSEATEVGHWTFRKTNRRKNAYSEGETGSGEEEKSDPAEVARLAEGF